MAAGLGGRAGALRPRTIDPEDGRMHEFALAEGVAVTALEGARAAGLRRITRLAISIGELQQLDRELFAAVLREVMPQIHAELEAVEVELRTVPAVLGCRACGREFGWDACVASLGQTAAEAVHFVPELVHAYVRCPQCGSPDYAIVRGRGVWLDQVEGLP